MRLVKLPEVVLSAYPSVLELKRMHATKLLPLLDDQSTSGLVLKKAEEISQAQKEGITMSGTEVFKALMKSTQIKKTSGMLLDETYKDASGNEVFRLKKTSAGGYSIAFNKKIACSKQDLKTLLNQAIDTHMTD